MDFVANFSLNRNDLEANFELNPPVQFDALFEINPAGASWGGITGTLSNQTDLQDALNLKADKTELDADVELLNQTITETYNTLDNKIDDVNSDLSGDISTLNTNIQNEATTRAENDSLLQGDINTLNTNLSAEINNRTTADSGLQTQINSVKQTADSAIQPNDNITLLNNNAGFITNAVNNLTNYYLKSETYTKTEVQALIASIPQFRVVVVQTLPVTGERMVLYLVPKDGEAPDVYNEYIWVEDEDEFELLGSTAVDLDGYATEVWVQNQGYATETYVDTGLATKQDTLTAGTGISIVNNVISNTQTSAEWGKIQGTLSNQTDLQNALNAKLNITDVTEYTAQEVETLWGSIQ